MLVRVPCDTCKINVTISLSDLHVRFCLDNCDCSYWFLCPVCDKRVVSQVHPSKRAQLLAHPSIHPGCWFLPEELREPKSGPPISEADLAAFREAIGA